MESLPLFLKEEEYDFVNRLHDLVSAVDQYQSPRFSSFLNEREQAIAISLLPSFPCEGMVFGGFSGAQRKMLALFPADYLFSKNEFPFSALYAKHLPQEKLNHRDVLGTLIGLGIARESIGDILPQEGRCDFILSTPTIPVIKENLRRIGRTGIRCEESKMHTLTAVTEFSSKRGTVSSIRLDALVSMLTGQSRDNSLALIQNECVQKNYLVEPRRTAVFQSGDIITVRGHGKYIVDTIGSPTRKHRLPVECRQYI